jgi:hypothetical protein
MVADHLSEANTTPRTIAERSFARAAFVKIIDNRQLSKARNQTLQ